MLVPGASVPGVSVPMFLCPLGHALMHKVAPRLSGKQLVPRHQQDPIWALNYLQPYAMPERQIGISYRPESRLLSSLSPQIASRRVWKLSLIQQLTMTKIWSAGWTKAHRVSFTFTQSHPVVHGSGSNAYIDRAALWFLCQQTLNTPGREIAACGSPKVSPGGQSLDRERIVVYPIVGL